MSTASKSTLTTEVSDTRTGGREVFPDQMRAIAMICVVANHAAASVSSTLDLNSEYKFILLLVNQLFTWAVPFFFFVSGYYSRISLDKNENSSSYFLRNRFDRLIVPFIIWTVFIDVLKYPNSNFIFIVFKDIALGAAMGPYYFIINLVILSIFSPLFVKLRLKSKFVLFCLILLLMHSVIYYIWLYLYGSVNWWYMLFPASAWAFYYFLGMAIADYPFWFARKFRLSFYPIVLLLFIILQVAETSILYTVFGYDSGARDPIKFSSILFSVCIIYFVAVNWRANIESFILKTISSCSLGIFFIHEPILRILTVGFNLYLPESLTVLKLVMLTTLGILMPVAFILVIRRLIGPASRHIGF